MSPPSSICRLQRCGLAQVDHCTQRLRRLLLPGRMPLPFGRPHELLEPRHGANSGKLCEWSSAPGLLRPHLPQPYCAALLGPSRPSGAEELSRHGGGGLRLPVVAPDSSDPLTLTHGRRCIVGIGGKKNRSMKRQMVGRRKCSCQLTANRQTDRDKCSSVRRRMREWI